MCSMVRPRTPLRLGVCWATIDRCASPLSHPGSQFDALAAGMRSNGLLARFTHVLTGVLPWCAHKRGTVMCEGGVGAESSAHLESGKPHTCLVRPLPLPLPGYMRTGTFLKAFASLMAELKERQAVRYGTC